MSHVVIVSGPPASGKSSVAESLCARYDRTVHLQTDDFYDSIRMGYIRPWFSASDRQNIMVTRAAARAAAAYAEELFAVMIDGVIGPHLLPVYIEELRSAAVPVHLALLLPTLDETIRRGLEREATIRVQEAQLRQMHAQFIEWGDFAGCTFDNTSMTADEAADAIMDACGRGDCLVSSGG